MKTNTKQPRQARSTHEGGKSITLVPLAGSPDPARLYAEDFEAIKAAGFSDQWFLDSDGKGHGYARVWWRDPTCPKAKARNLAVARLIMRPEPGEKVCYLDGNRLNLRRDNLTLERGARRAKADKRGSRAPQGFAYPCVVASCAKAGCLRQFGGRVPKTAEGDENLDKALKFHHPKQRLIFCLSRKGGWQTIAGRVVPAHAGDTCPQRGSVPEKGHG